jgi:hypothetical protein
MSFFDAEHLAREDFRQQFGLEYGDKFYDEYRGIQNRFTEREEVARGWPEFMSHEYKLACEYGVSAVKEEHAAWLDKCDQYYPGTANLGSYI